MKIHSSHGTELNKLIRNAHTLQTQNFTVDRKGCGTKLNTKIKRLRNTQQTESKFQ